MSASGHEVKHIGQRERKSHITTRCVFQNSKLVMLVLVCVKYMLRYETKMQFTRRCRVADNGKHFLVQIDGCKWDDETTG